MKIARLAGLACTILCSCGAPSPGEDSELGQVQEPLTVLSDGFETGALAPRWSTSGQVAVTTAAVRTGTYGVRLNGTASLTLSFDTLGLGEPTISYGRRAAHLDSGERLFVEWRPQGESTWRTLQSMGNSSWTTSTFTLTGATDTAISVRFRTNASSSEERADLDNVTITADPLPTCTDLVKSGTETDVDCGGGSCAPCDVGQSCGAARDCVSATCASQVCRAAQTNQRVAVLLFDYAGNGLQQSPQVIRDAMFTAPNSIARYYQDASYGRVNLTGDVFGWYRPSKPLFGSGWTNCWPALDTDMFADVASTVTLANYDKFLLVVHDVEKTGCAAGTSSFGPTTHQTPQGPITASVSRMRGPFYPSGDFSGTTQSTVLHELGHSFGVDYHANAYLCTGSPLSLALGNCSIGSTGDVFDRMGLGSQSTHFNTSIKQGLGWLPASNVRTVTKSGTFTVLRQEVQQTGIQLLRIPLRAPVQMHTFDNSNDIYMQELLVEYRGMTGFDARNTFFRTIQLQNGGSFFISNTQGALVRGAICKGGLCPHYLLDMHPQAYVPAYAPNEAADAYLYPNETFGVPGNSISLQTLSADANSVTVRVDITNLCGNGQLDPGERCDAGSGNSTNLGACRPDCQGRVQERRIRRSSMRILPNFGGVAGADALCRIEFGPGYRSLIADGVRRVASVTANQGDGQLDWVLQPFTRYVNESNALVWTTDSAALLGVTNGTHQALLAPISGDDGWATWGGFRNDWTSNPHTCLGWTSSSATNSGAITIVSATAAAVFPNNNTASACSATRRLVCVQ